MFLSTTGMGVAPDSGFSLENWLQKEINIKNFEVLKNVNYCVMIFKYLKIKLGIWSWG